MTRTEKRLEVLRKQIDETESRIRTDTENLNQMKEEFDSLTAKKISDFAKKKNIVIDDKFFEMLSMVCHMDSEGKAPEDIKLFVPVSETETKTDTADTEKTNISTLTEDEDYELF